jgi:hypothetical protein
MVEAATSSTVEVARDAATSSIVETVAASSGMGAPAAAAMSAWWREAEKVEGGALGRCVARGFLPFSGVRRGSCFVVRAPARFSVSLEVYKWCGF